MPEAIIWIVSAIGVETGTAALIMYATEIAYTAIILGGLAYSSAKSRQAKQAAKDQYNAAQVDRLASLSTALAPRDLVLGRVRKGGTIFYKGSTGTNQQDLYMAVALAGHEIDAVEQIYLNDVLVALDGSGYVTTEPYNITDTLTGQGNTGAGTTLTLPATYVAGSAHGSVTFDVSDRGRQQSDAVAVTVSGLVATAAQVGTDISYQYTTDPVSVRITTHLGAPGQTADADLLAAFPADWGSANVVQGVAYLVLKLSYSEKAFPTGVPNVTAVVRGAKVYDPRTGVTAWSQNPALLIRHVYQHAKFGKASVSAAEDARIVSVANTCDTTGAYTTRAGTGVMGAVLAAFTASVPLFRAAVVAPFGTPARSLLDDLSQSMGGSWAFAGGELYLKAGVYSAPVMALTDADLAVVQRTGATESQKPISISVHKERAQKFNTVKATIWDAAQDYKQVALTPLVAAALVTRDGVELVQEVILPAVGYAPQALHISGIMMRDARDSLVVDLPVKLRAYPLELFDTISLTLSRYGWSAKTFTVLGRTWNADGSIQLTLKETTAAITQMDSGFLPQGFAANTNLPKPWLVGAVGTLTITSGTSELLTQGDGTIVSRMRISWPQVQDAAVVQNGQIEVQYRRADSTGAWTSLVTAGNETTVVTSDVQDGIIYTVRARARTSVAVGDWSLQVASNVAGKSAAPAAPTATATGGMFMVQVSWAYANSNADMLGTEVWWSATNNRTAAARLSFEPYPGTSYQHIGLSAGQGGYYWLRVVNTSSVVSSWYPSSSTGGLYAVASSDPTALMTQILGAVKLVQLNPELADSFVVGAVNGITMVGLQGNMVVDGSLLARSLVAKTISAASGVIDDLAVDTLQIAGNAVTVPVGGTLVDSTSTTYSRSIIVSGLPSGTTAQLFISAGLVAYTNAPGTTLNTSMSVSVNGTAISSDLFISGVPGAIFGSQDIGNGTYTVTITIAAISPYSLVGARRMTLLIQAIKR